MFPGRLFRRARQQSRSTWALITVILVLVGLAGFAVVTLTSRKFAGPPHAPDAPSVSGVVAVPPHFVAPPNPAAHNYQPGKVSWPAADTSVVHLSATQAATDPHAPISFAAAGSSAPTAVQVQVLDHKTSLAAGVNGVVFALSGDHAGNTSVGLDYGAFAAAFGGNFGARLRLVALPTCALTTPQEPACRVASPLPSVVNNAKAHTVSAQVSVPGPVTTTAAVLTGPSFGPVGGGGRIVLATSSDPGTEGGSGGTYAATDLKPSGSWTGGGSSGEFTYSYPIAVDSAPSAVGPELGLAYDSSSTDGQTASTQAQASWAGEGWSTPHSYLEESFTACSDNPEGSPAPVSTSDMCYAGPILALSLDGSTTSLVWDAGSSTWRPQNDDGSVVVHVTNSNNGQGTYNTDYWTVTTRDGTVYSFGRNHLPGWSSGKAATNSVDSEPVYSAHSGDPCYNAAGFTSSVCTMAYRWNLDYVVDVHGNAMAYYFNQDTNFYGEDNGAHNVSYVRDSHLDHIDYGFTDGNAYGTVADKVVFGTGDRCVSGTCDPLNSTTAPNWPDVPFDLVCASGATCASHGPAFFSTVRLTSVATQQYSTASSSYQTTDTWALTQSIPPTGDGTSPTLWLSSIVHTGSDLAGDPSASPITLPPVSFTGVQLQNRVDSVTDGLPAFYKYRIATITTESGSVIGVSYGLPNACTAPVTLTPATNTSSCYPVSWTPTGSGSPINDWFNKYVVTGVVQTDPTGGAPAFTTAYSYLGGAAWHYDENELVQAKYRTYGQFRGYGDVKTFTGDGSNDPRTLSEKTYYRGMSKDNNATVVNVTDSQGGTHEDIDQLAGRELESSTYLGEGGPVDSSEINSYWLSAPSARRTRTGLPDLTANVVATAESFKRQALTGTAPTTWRNTETDTTYDASTSSATFGLATRTYTHTVPANASFDRCTSNTYAAANSTKNLVGLIAETETDSVACGGFTEGSPATVPSGLNALTAPASVNRPSQVVSDVRTFYDDNTWSTTFPQVSPPNKGDATMIRKAVDYTGGAFVYQSDTRTGYDSLGRKTDTYDGNGDHTQIGFTANAVGLVTGQTVTNALGQVMSTTREPQRGLVLTSSDINGVTTTQRYDALGRTDSVWTNSRATTSPANFVYTYIVSNTGTTAVTTQKLNDESGYITSTLIYDALLRPRQTQAVTPQSGRLVTDSFYDSHGWAKAKYNGWWDSATTPNTTLVSAANLQDSVPSQDFMTYDGLGRVVVDVSSKDGVEISRTTTVYNGDRQTVIAPTGGVTQTTMTDPLGRTSELDQYTSAPTLHSPSSPYTGYYTVSDGSTQATAYGFDAHGFQSSVTQGSGPTWTTTHNLLGQVTARTDPDAGAATGITYDGDGNQVQLTDARGKTVSFTYDALNRRTGEYLSTVAGQIAGPTGNQLAALVYDNSNNAVSSMTYPKGHLTTSQSFWNGNTYTTQQKNFNVFGESTGVIVTLPAAEGGLAGSYTFSKVYTPTTGLPLKDIYPAAGGLPSETVLHGYAGALDLPNTVGGLTGYDQGTTYDAFGRVNQQTLGAGTNLAYITNTWDPHTGRLSDQLLTRAVATPSTVDEQAFQYDLSGNLTRQISTRLGSTSETQCFGYDGLAQLTAAWTATDNCAAQPTTASHAQVADNLGSASAYWTTWSIDGLGDRSQQVQHAFTGGPNSDITTAYSYGVSGAQPHTLTGTSITGGATGSSSYGYNADGSMTTRNAGLGSQTLNYNDAGQLTSVTGGATGDSAFIYAADGALLLQKDPTTTTLYLGSEQLTLNAGTGAVSGTRYIGLPFGGTVVRTGSGTNYSFTLGDDHSTPVLYLDNTAQTPTWRQYTPYGGSRGGSVAAPDNHGFLNKPIDGNTGLTVVGAREYDPATGRFVTVDPMLETTDPSQLNGYGYAGNNPVAHSDPTGLCRDDPGTPCGDGHMHDGNGLDGPWIPGPAHQCGVCGPAGIPVDTSPVVKISPHVAIHTDDPMYQYYKDQYAYYADWKRCFWVCNETDIWRNICFQQLSSEPSPCTPAFKHALGMDNELTEILSRDELSGAGAVIVGAGTFRSITDPYSMVGVTEQEVEAMVPPSWTASPTNDGDGVKWMSPRDGRYGQVRYLRDGNPNNPDPLHAQGDHLTVRVGGLQYRVAAGSNPVIDDPNIPSVQIQSLGEMGPLFPPGTEGGGFSDLPIEPGEVPIVE
jgi:RHS repeat-associated protein